MQVILKSIGWRDIALIKKIFIIKLILHAASIAENKKTGKERKNSKDIYILAWLPRTYESPSMSKSRRLSFKWS